MVGTIARVLSVEVDQVLAAASYDDASGGSALDAVRPLVRDLPIEELPADRFEDLSVEIAQHLYPDSHASRFGGSGETQGGIDVLVDGTRTVTIQCKRRRQFGPQDVARMVADTKVEASTHYLFLAKPTATAAARSEIAKYPGWQLWDGEDLSRYIRSQMSTQEALRLVDTYFPNHREPFLGIARPGPWLTTSEFFAPASGVQIFTHAWALAGRTREVRELLDSIRTDDSGVTLLSGRGGVGKTRLLRSVAETLEGEGWVVRLLPVGGRAEPGDFELLPTDGRLLVVLDDAQDRADIADVLAQLRRRNLSAKVLIATRPYGELALSHDLRRVGLMSSGLPTVRLSDLTLEESKQLAREALGSRH
jgi:hypothetical protein